MTGADVIRPVRPNIDLTAEAVAGGSLAGRPVTLVSAHPSISKWWWSGVKRKIRFPWVSL